MAKKAQSGYRYKINRKKEFCAMMPTSDYNSFNVDRLNIGDPIRPSISIECLAVVFDLEGFTKFSSAQNPKNVVPPFLNSFLAWLFSEIKKQLTEKRIKNEIHVYWQLPFFAKFLGDGILLLFSTSVEELQKQNPQVNSTLAQQYKNEAHGNLILALDNICKKYEEFRNKNAANFIDMPTILRCGAAHGDVCTFGADYVGPCINLASRLQDLHGLTFAFSANNFDPTKALLPKNIKRFKKVSAVVRGVHAKELVYVRTDEYQRLVPESLCHFAEPGKTPKSAKAPRRKG